VASSSSSPTHHHRHHHHGRRSVVEQQRKLIGLCQDQSNITEWFDTQTRASKTSAFVLQLVLKVIKAELCLLCKKCSNQKEKKNTHR
jgi:hypothetical protein